MLGLESPEEMRVAAPLVGGAPGEEDYRRYEEWLRRRGDDRARIMELDRVLASEPRVPDRAARREELRRLAASADPTWWRLVSRSSGVLSCGKSDALGPERFAFECDRRWSTLEATDDPGVRRCDGCERAVYWCDDEAQVADRALRGECVVVPRAVLRVASDEHLPRTVTGRPDPLYYWGKAIFGGEPPPR